MLVSGTIAIKTLTTGIIIGANLYNIVKKIGAGAKVEELKPLYKEVLVELDERDTNVY